MPVIWIFSQILHVKLYDNRIIRLLKQELKLINKENQENRCLVALIFHVFGHFGGQISISTLCHCEKTEMWTVRNLIVVGIILFQNYGTRHLGVLKKWHIYVHARGKNVVGAFKPKIKLSQFSTNLTSFEALLQWCIAQLQYTPHFRELLFHLCT